MIGPFARALPTLLRIGVAEAVAYRSELVVWLLTTNTPVIMLLVWTAVAREAPVGGYGSREFAAYFLAALIVRLLTGAWVVWEMNEEIRSGALAMRLVRPVHPFLAYATENLGALPVRSVFVLPLVGVFLLWLGPDILTGDVRQVVLLPLALIGAWALWFSSMLCGGCLALFWERSLSVFEVWLAAYVAFSGYVVPLALFPDFLQPWVKVLPFAFVLSFPVEILLGTASFESTLQGLGLQWTYVVSFCLLALVLWRRGIRRYEAFGG